VTTAHRLHSPADLWELRPEDMFVRCEADPSTGGSAWASAAAVGWTGQDEHGRPGWLTMTGEPAAAAALAATAMAELPHRPRGLTLPRGGPAHLPDHLHLPKTADWEWFWTASAPPPVPGEERVGWLAEGVDAEVAELLRRASPRHSGVPGDPRIRRWCGIREAAGRLVACAAHMERVAGVPHLASITRDPAPARRGLGTALTAWLTRRLLEEGSPVVTLGMYSDNEVARRMYWRLGYRCDHEFTSGRLPAEAEAVPTT